jgi:hypothetical protein
MSEAGLIIGLISGIIQIINAAEQVYEAAKDAKGQPTAFREVAARLPLVINILSLAKQKMENQPVDEESSVATEYLVKSCEEKALQLKVTLEKCLPTDDAELGTRIWKGMQTVPRGNRVETLMQGILKDIVMLAGNYGLRAATAEQVKELARAIEALGDLAPSAFEEISSVANTSYGGGAIYSNTGTAPQQINNGRGNFYNNNVNGTVQTMFGSKRLSG